jgi:hypothetical protein
MFGLGPNTVLLDLHGVLMFVTLIFSAFLFGAIFFVHDPSAVMVRRLKISSVIAFLGLLGLMITGIIPDISFGSGSTFSGTVTNDFGTFVNKVSDTSLGNFTGPLLFDMMEHVSLIVPGLAAVIGFLILYLGRRVMTEPAIKASVLSLMFVAGVWTFVLGAIGVYITKVLTFPAGS